MNRILHMWGFKGLVLALTILDKQKLKELREFSWIKYLVVKKKALKQ